MYWPHISLGKSLIRTTIQQIVALGLTVMTLTSKKVQKQYLEKQDVEMACQKVCKQGRYNA